jgi:hypothetical protein
VVNAAEARDEADIGCWLLWGDVSRLGLARSQKKGIRVMRSCRALIYEVGVAGFYNVVR